MSNFKDVELSRKSEVWHNFTYCKTTKKAKCKLYQAILKAAGSSAKGLITHLKSQHKIAVKSSRVKVAKIDGPKLKMRKVDSFFKSEKQSLGELVSQLTAIDGLTFNQIATSERLRRALKANRYDLPRSHKKVLDLLMKQREDIVKTI